MGFDDEFSAELGSRMEPPRRRPSVFISYRREDAAGYAGHLNDSLLRWLDGWRLFLDVGSIQPGWEFGQAIEHAVQHADAFIALIGPRWLGPDASRILAPDDFVRVEVAAALAAGIPVIPVLVQDARLPPAAQLPEELRPLLRKHAIELRDETWRQDVERLAHALQQLVQDRRRRAAQPVTPSPNPGPMGVIDLSHVDEGPRMGDASTGAMSWRALEQSVRAHPLGYSALIAGVLVVVLIAAAGLGVDGSVRRDEEPRTSQVPIPPESDRALEPLPNSRPIDANANVAGGVPPLEPPTPPPGAGVPPAAKPETPRIGTRSLRPGEANTRPRRPPTRSSPAPSARPDGRVTASGSGPAEHCREPRRAKNVEAITPAGTKVHGDVRVQYEVDERGQVRSATVINSDRRRRGAGLEQAALDAVRQWEFEPLAKGCPPWTRTITIVF